MRKLALLWLLAGLAPGALAARRVTVRQVEQLLAASHHLSDAKLGAKIDDLELLERAGPARLKRWQEEFPGKRTQAALLALADASSFLAPPAAEMPALPAPDAAERTAIFARAVAYVQTTLKKLPDFLARRTTIHYDDLSPAERLHSLYLVDGSMGIDATMAPVTAHAEGSALLPVGEPASLVVTYRDGHEVADTKPGMKPKAPPPWIGLTTSGEFGPILSVVTGDAAHGKIFWGHWEQGAHGPVAVLWYEVRQEDSHFEVTGTGNMPRCPSYHGEIAIDPASGTILRVSLISDWKPPFQPSVSAILVEYGPVEIGGVTYICPIKGVALSRVAPRANADSGGGRVDFPMRTFLNDVSFTDYHVFRGNVRILP